MIHRAFMAVNERNPARAPRGARGLREVRQRVPHPLPEEPQQGDPPRGRGRHTPEDHGLSGIRGKLAKGKNGRLEIDEDRIVIKEEKGLFSKRFEEIEGIALSQTTSTAIDEKLAPYRNMIRIKMA